MMAFAKYQSLILKMRKFAKKAKNFSELADWRIRELGEDR
jgi:hypothetical protein